MRTFFMTLLLVSFYAGSVAAGTLEIRALDTNRSENIKSGATDGYGDVIITRPPGNIPTSAGYDVNIDQAGNYKLSIEYAALDPRPIFVTVNGQQITGNALSGTTGGWFPGNQVIESVGTVPLKAGKNTILLSRSSAFPHIRTIILDGPQ